MTALLNRPSRLKRRVPAPRRTRIDAPSRDSEVYRESLYLRHWTSRQVSGYQSLLTTIAAVRMPGQST